MSWQLEKSGTGSKLTFTYSVGGYYPGGLDTLAAVVDGVLTHQVQRLKEYRRTPLESDRKVRCRRRSVASLVIVSAAVVTLAAQTAPTLPATPIQVDRLTAHIKEVSSDAYEGRGPGTRAEQKVVDYLSKQLAAAGVQPGGDPDGRGGRKWTQAVTLLRSEISGPMTASVSVAGGHRTAEAG